MQHPYGQRRKSNTFLWPPPKHPALFSLCSQAAISKQGATWSLLQLRCLLNRCRGVFKHERKYPQGGNSHLPQLPGPCVPSVGAATKQTQPCAVTTSAASRKLMGDARTHTRGSDGVISWLQWSHPDFQQLRSCLLAHKRVLIRNCLLSLHASVTMMGSLNLITVKSKRTSALPFIAFFMWWLTELSAPQKHNPKP